MQKISLPNLTMGGAEWLSLVVLSVIWGGSFFLIKIALQDFSPLFVVVGRIVVAAIALNLFVYGTGHKMPTSPATWGKFMIMGVLNNIIPFSLIVWGQTHISSSLASILNATNPLFIVILAHFLTKDEKLTIHRLLGVVIGLVGAVVLIAPDLHNLSWEGWGQLAVLGGAIFYAFGGIYARGLKQLPPMVVAAGTVTCSTLVLLPIGLILEGSKIATARGTSWLAVVTLGFLCTAIAYLLYFRLIAVAGATNAALVTFLIPISASILGIFILHEKLESNAIIGMTLIFAGLAVIDGRLWRRKKA
jgi:drug/metabolite transporter (DMT)-like permease